MYGEEFVLKEERDRKRASHILLNQRSPEFIARRQEQNRKSAKTYYEKKNEKAQEKIKTKRKDQLAVQRKYSLKTRRKKQEQRTVQIKYSLRARTKTQEKERKNEN